MNAKAIFKAKLSSPREAAALAHAAACSYFSARTPAGCGSDLAMATTQARPMRTFFDHDCLHQIGRTLVENGEHLSCMDAQDMKRPAKILGMVQSEAELAERVKDLKPCSTGGRLGATWNYVRTERPSRDGTVISHPGGRKKRTAMRISELVRASAFSALVAASLLGAAGEALAFDDKVFDDKTGVKPQSSPWAVFQFGFSAYKSGHKDQAVEAYRYAAENGQIGATWKLARMYAEGDGVAQNDYEAFKFFTEIAEQDVEPGSPEESYVSDALVALGGYMKEGIPGSPVSANPVAAQEYYMRAAANYRNPNAQYEMGKMFLRGDGGVKVSVKQAGRWLQLAAEKGHAGAQATLGNLLFQSGKVVRGLAMMTAALERAQPSDQPWIRGMQEEAFALADESDRRTAISLAEDILTKGNQ
ncbi:TPR repeat protein [Aminobacter sp. AP02]|nr:TPR repeat protein [Aminobacter sp. AP02]